MRSESEMSGRASAARRERGVKVRSRRTTTAPNLGAKCTERGQKRLRFRPRRVPVVVYADIGERTRTYRVRLLPGACRIRPQRSELVLLPLLRLLRSSAIAI